MAFGFDVSEEPSHGLKVVKHAKPTRFWLSESNPVITEVSLMSDGSYELGFLPPSKAAK
jgi:hypothetical protein